MFTHPKTLTLSILKHHFPVSLIFFLTFTILTKPPFGGDFGWHLMTGQHIVTTLSIPQTDLFSHSAPNYPYAYHSWSTEILMYLIYSKFSLIGVAAFFAAISSAAFTLLTKMSLSKLGNPLYLLAIPTLAIPIDMLTGISIRIQSLSFLFLAISHFLFSKSPSPIKSKLSFLSWLKQTRLWLLPPLFLLWANLHGGFILGLGFYLLTILTHLATHIHRINLASYKKLYRFHLTTLTICALATLINPYTYRVHTLALTMVTNRAAAAANIDWVPFHLRTDGNAPALFLLLIIPFLLTTLLTRLSPHQKLLLTATFLLTFASPRFSLLLITLLTPMIPITLERIFKLLKKTPSLFWLSTLTLTLTAPLLFFKVITTNAKNLICAQYSQVCFAQIGKQAEVFYPFGAVEFLKHHPLKPNILNNFNWGGYLTWQLPGIKVFADGKMDNYIVDGQSFITTYQNLVLAEPGWPDLLNQYHINSVLLDPSEPLVSKLISSPDWQVIFQNDISTLLEKK